MKVVQLLPDGHRMKREVDAALDTVSETMTPMHYHLREIIVCTYRQVSPPLPRAQPGCGCHGWEVAGIPWTLLGSQALLHLLEVEMIPEMETCPAPTGPAWILECKVGCVQP